MKGEKPKERMGYVHGAENHLTAVVSARIVWIKEKKTELGLANMDSAHVVGQIKPLPVEDNVINALNVQTYTEKSKERQ